MMSLVNSIASFSIAKSMAEVQMAVAAKVLKMAQGQDQVAAELVSAAVENVQQAIEDLVGDLGSNFDACA